MRNVLVIGLLALLPAFGHADYCAERTEVALGELAQLQDAAPASENAAQTRAVLERLCRDAHGAGSTAMTETVPAAKAASTAATADAEPAAQAEAPKEPESTRILGVEIKQAPKGAAGYERASKGP